MPTLTPQYLSHIFSLCINCGIPYHEGMPVAFERCQDFRAREIGRGKIKLKTYTTRFVKVVFEVKPYLP